MLEVKQLSIHFADCGVREEAVREVSFTMKPAEILGIVGESGSGKTLTALTIAGLLKTNARLESGEILLEGTNLLALNRKEWRNYQGNEISMIFQEPMTALNPTMKIGRQVEEVLLLHTNLSKEERKQRVLKAMEDVELEHPEILYRKYPHELSGGMRQRVMIAAAIVCRPKLLIADEPTTALDVNTQESILQLLRKLNQKYQVGILFISHNLRVIKSLCENVLVMKEGRIIERGKTEEIFEFPKQEYTKQLIAAIPTRTGQNKYYELLMQKQVHKCGKKC
ncbi:MAG: ABC transporter ATP-binding protein [Hespellia sp.]|nr:ABC transporter ATP-binding protein [Hespellia sp.]